MATSERNEMINGKPVAVKKLNSTPASTAELTLGIYTYLLDLLDLEISGILYISVLKWSSEVFNGGFYGRVKV